MTVATMFAQETHLASTPLCAQPSGTRRAARQPMLVRATYAAEAPPQSSKGTGMSQLDALKTMSTIVADTGEIESIRSFKPIDCTTNPRCAAVPSIERLVRAHWDRLGPITQDFPYN